MVFKKSQAENIVERLNFIKLQIGDLEKFTALSWEIYRTDRDTQRNVERLAENTANAAIDICKILLVEAEVEMPNSYKEIILKLGEINILDADLANKLSEYAGLRNYLSHQYLDLKWDKIKAFIANAKQDFDRFVEVVSLRVGAG